MRICYTLSCAAHRIPVDNNEGITVIDVTNPEDPAYCFYRDDTSELEDAEGYILYSFAIPDREEQPESESDEQFIPEHRLRMPEDIIKARVKAARYHE